MNAKSNVQPKVDMAEKLVYNFGDGSAEGKADMKDLLGGKGANLAEMCALGLPVPPGFTITTDVCVAYYANEKKLPSGLETQVKTALSQVEKKAGCVFGDGSNPLLVSVRSGARASMPGMMDTVLNLGLNDTTVKALAKKPVMSALPMTVIAASSRCIPTWCWDWSITISRTCCRRKNPIVISSSIPT